MADATSDSPKGGDEPPSGEGADGPPGGDSGGASTVVDRPNGSTVVDLDPRTAVVASVAFIALLALFGAARDTTRSLTWLVIGALLALALNPLVSTVQRRFRCRRGVGVALVLVGFLTAVSGLVLLLGPPAVHQANQFSKELPKVLDDLGNLPFVGKQLRANDVPAKVQKWIEDLPHRLSGDTSPIESISRSVISGALAGFTTLLVTIVLLLDGERLLRAARRAVPERHRERLDRLGDLFYRIVGRYFAGSLLVALTAGTVMLIGGLLFRVPLAPLAALWITSTNLIPQIGGAVGGIPFVLLGLSRSATTGVLCAVWFVAYQNLENHVIQPTIVGDAVDLTPPATMVAALIGVSAAGVPGALLATPLLGAAKAIARELRSPGAADRRERRPSRRERISSFVRRRRRR